MKALNGSFHRPQFSDGREESPTSRDLTCEVLITFNIIGEHIVFVEAEVLSFNMSYKIADTGYLLDKQRVVEA